MLYEKSIADDDIRIAKICENAKKYKIGKSYPVIKHSGNNRISAWFSEASFIAIMIVSIFLSICSLIERFYSIATLNIHFPSYR